MSAKIIQLIPRQDRKRGLICFPTIAFGRARRRDDDLSRDHVDTAPCEYVGPEPQPSEPGNA
jgi:hypothetical protein